MYAIFHQLTCSVFDWKQINSEQIDAANWKRSIHFYIFIHLIAIHLCSISDECGRWIATGGREEALSR